MDRRADHRDHLTMGKKKAGKEAAVMEPAPGSLSPQASFVACLPCHYCQDVSFEESDLAAYSAHLTSAHGVTKNVESLVRLTLEEQRTKALSPLPATASPPPAVTQPASFKLPTEEMTTDWMDDDIGVMEEEEEEEVTKIPKPEPEPSAQKPSSFSLPITEMTDDWMNDDIGIIDEEEEDVVKEEKKEEKKVVDKKTSKDKSPTTDTKSKIEKPKRKDKNKPIEKEETSPVKDGPQVKGKMTGTVEHSPEVKKLLEQRTAENKVPEKAGVGYLEKKAAEKKAKEKKAVEEKAAKKAAEKLATEKKALEKVEFEKKAAEEKATAQKVVAEKKAAEKKVAQQKAEAEKKVAEQKIAGKKAASDKKNIDAKKEADKASMDKTYEEKKVAEQKAASKKETEKPKKAAEKKSDIDSIMDDWLNDSEIDEATEKAASVKKNIDSKKAADKAAMNKKAEEKKLSEQKSVAKKEAEKSKKAAEKKSDIDSIMDDWLNASEIDGADDSIPDELPDIDDVDEAKKRTTKQKLSTVIPSPNDRLTNIMDDAANKNVKNTVEDWFKGTGSMTVPNEAYNLQSLPKEEKAVEDKKSLVPQGDCAVCGKLAKALCSGCKHIFYCSREHQKKHWASHKEECKAMARLPWRVERDDTVGRFLVATKDLEEGELIINETPMVVGPRQLTKPVCLGCYKEITATTPWKPCVRCHWPVCSLKCQDSPHHDAECRATQAAGARVRVEHFDQINMMYACITVLRALGLKEGPRKIWEDYTK